jgi:hypothetical protein
MEHINPFFFHVGKAAKIHPFASPYVKSMLYHAVQHDFSFIIVKIL